MYNKKEVILGIVIVLFFSGLVYYLPTLEKKIFNRNNIKYTEDKEEETRSIKYYYCTKTEEDKVTNSSTTLNSTLYFTDKVLTRTFVKSTTSYYAASNYKLALTEVKEDISDDNHTRETILDETNRTIIVNEGKNLSDKITSEYPTDFDELTEYLDKNDYVCTVKYN